MTSCRITHDPAHKYFETEMGKIFTEELKLKLANPYSRKRINTEELKHQSI